MKGLTIELVAFYTVSVCRRPYLQQFIKMKENTCSKKKYLEIMKTHRVLLLFIFYLTAKLMMYSKPASFSLQ